MAFDLSLLAATPDLRSVPPVHARLVCAMRYAHMARASGNCPAEGLARYLGGPGALRGFRVFMDEAGRAWPDPIALHHPCDASFSYDEMLLVDLATAAARNDRGRFDTFARDMIGRSGREAIWRSARRLMRHLVTVAQ